MNFFTYLSIIINVAFEYMAMEINLEDTELQNNIFKIWIQNQLQIHGYNITLI